MRSIWSVLREGFQEAEGVYIDRYISNTLHNIIKINTSWDTLFLPESVSKFNSLEYLVLAVLYFRQCELELGSKGGFWGRGRRTSGLCQAPFTSCRTKHRSILLHRFRHKPPSPLSDKGAFAIASSPTSGREENSRIQVSP